VTILNPPRTPSPASLATINEAGCPFNKDNLIIQLLSPGVGKKANAGFRCAIGRLPWEGNRRVRRATQHNRATVGHQRQGLLNREQQPPQVDIESQVVFFFRNLAEEFDRVTDARVREDNVNSPFLASNSGVKTI
jgi:hypothetical protein